MNPDLEAPKSEKGNNIKFLTMNIFQIEV